MPALGYFSFNGAIEYLEDLVTFIDVTRLYALFITLFHQIDFDGPRHTRFISRTRTLKKHEVHVRFHDRTASFGLFPIFGSLGINISCIEPDRQLSSIAQDGRRI